MTETEKGRWLSEDELLIYTINNIKNAHQYPDFLFDKSTWIAIQKGYQHSYAELYRKFTGFQEESGGFRVRTFIPEDFGFDTFVKRFKMNTEQQIWIPEQYHSEAVRVIIGIIEHENPAIDKIISLVNDRHYAMEPSRWIYDKITQAWYIKLIEPYIILKENLFEIAVYLNENLMEKIEFNTEDIASSLKGENPIKCNLEPLGVIFTKNEYRVTKDYIKNRVKFSKI